MTPAGNGSTKFPIHQQDMGGWVRIFTDESAHVPDDFPTYLSLSLSEWFRLRPNLRMKCVVPIVRAGRTIELHAWFEVHLFPAAEGTATPDELA